MDLARIRDTLHGLRVNLHQAAPDQIKRMLQQAIPDYAPCLGQGDASLPPIASLDQNPRRAQPTLRP